MKIEDFCKEVEIDQVKVMDRFMGNVSLYLRFVNKFLEDKNYDTLVKAVGEGDYDTIHMSSHTLKGISFNLGFDKLGQLCDAVVKAVREEKYESLGSLIENVGTEYTKIVSLIENELEA